MLLPKFESFTKLIVHVLSLFMYSSFIIADSDPIDIIKTYIETSIALGGPTSSEIKKVIPTLNATIPFLSSGTAKIMSYNLKKCSITIKFAFSYKPNPTKIYYNWSIKIYSHGVTSVKQLIKHSKKLEKKKCNLGIISTRIQINQHLFFFFNYNTFSCSRLILVHLI